VDAALLWFGLLWTLLGGRRSSPSQTTPETAPPALPPAGPTEGPPAAPPAPAPWPSIVPSGLPPFPSSAWEYDEPPPPEVQSRARALLSELWARGSGAWRAEKTGGRWIVYRAEIVRGGKRGVVAFRERAATEARPVAAPAARPVATTRPPAARPVAAPAARPVAAPAARPVAAPAARPAPPPAAAAQPPITTPGSSPLSLPTLRQGVGMRPQAPNADVRLLQTKLAIGADGRFGPGTRAAVVAFQRRRGLDPDGIVGPLTWTALFSVRA
jgi:peptidoglycan hydrolase-like protein with peptidoglycan-binding domain